MSLLTRNLFGNQDLGLLVYRLVIGACIFMHGLAKMQGGEATLTTVGSAVANVGIHEGFFIFGTLAALTEIIGGVLVCIGLFTRLGALGVAITMLFAFLFQMDNGIMKWIYPIEVGVGFLMLFLAGPGRFSIDAMISGKR